MSRKKKTDVIVNDVLIESVAAEGKAVAHVDGCVLFVEFAVPGDVVDVRVTRKRKNWCEGRIVRFIKKSEQRLEPFCEHFGVCGGCRWQNLPYPQQLEAKRRQVCDQLVRIGHLEVPEIRPTVGSAKTVEYRNKLEFSASNHRWLSSEEIADANVASSPALGYHIGRYFDKVLDIRHCHLQPEPSNAIRLFVREYALEHSIPFYDFREHKGVLRNMFIRTSSGGDVMLIMIFGEKFPEMEPMLDAVAAAFPEISSLYYSVNVKPNDSAGDLDFLLYKGVDAIYETMEGLKFRIGPKSFYQTNSAQAYELYKVVREFAALTGSETVYDLYSGTGTIAQFVSSKAARVIGVEYVAEAVSDAVANTSMNGISNCEFFAGDMKDILTSAFIALHGHPDVMIVDPPRAGMHPDVVKVIREASPERIVYVSCNPASQARDLQLLCEAGDDGGKAYRITAVQPVDMFPHTVHVENVVALERNLHKIL